MIRTGLVLIVVAGAFAAGQWRGELTRSTKDAVFLKTSAALMHERGIGVRDSQDLRNYCGAPYPMVFSDLHDDVCWTRAPAIAAELRDCNDAMDIWVRSLAHSTGADYDSDHPLPGLRYLNPEGEIVTYHLPPMRKRTGSVLGPHSVRRDAGYIDPTR